MFARQASSGGRSLGFAVLLMTALAAGPPAPAVVRGPAVEPGLVGTWRWEAESVYAPEASLILTATRWVRISADGAFVYQEEGSQTGTRRYSGRVTGRGGFLLARAVDGRTLAVRYRLSGTDGLYLDGALYERVR